MKIKKTIKYLLMPFVLLCTQLSPAEATTIVVKGKVRIEWGRNSQKCAGNGLCFVHEGSVIWNAYIGRDESNTMIVFDVIPERNHENEDLFSEKYFLMEEHFKLPEEMRELLELEDSVVIPPGKYKMEHLDRFIRIYLPFKKSFAE
ncbi:MAG: hypothetical protein DWQ44_01370 [Bacteroidetes bacterium]|nr:MAG: hypothetical protein DWQ33_00835 [Bacteroidota bacterium]REK04933.1 MAG: hypothetical protein DWQ39_06885 [Bacteroidota bacterium]REK36563.1 MAG: hypothetical protein DWQ44_01370 [Bacteroidota bacterium]REK50929.1 MAG: hypothetical protein DWQ48_02230 [Bacteroidota bacterium]